MTSASTHPLVRQGTQQRERLLLALVPANLKLDDRAMADLIALVGQLAGHIRYWPDTNTLPEVEPNWEKFWQTDATPLLAVMTATDLVDLRSQYRNLELAYLHAQEASATADKTDGPKPDELLTKLVEQIFETARITFDLYKKLPATHPLKAEFSRLIREKLRAPLRQLIAYHKGVSTVDLLNTYRNEAFIDTPDSQQPWGLTSINEFRNAIRLQRPNNTDREPLWRLFLTFYGVLSTMVAKTGKSFQYALQSRSDHPPHVALLLTFLHLFRHLQADFNALPEKHLLFYYQDVLRLQQRQAIPDRVHVVFEMAQNLERYRLLAGTPLRGGTDRLGRERLYALEAETVISKAKLVEQKSIYFLKNSPVTPIVEAKNANGLSAKAAYTQLVAKIKRLEGGSFSELATSTQKLLSPAALEQLARWKAEKSRYEARPGLVICTPELWMEPSAGRRISVQFTNEIDALPFTIHLSAGRSLQAVTNRVTKKIAEELDKYIDQTNAGSTDGPQDVPNPFAGKEPSFFVAKDRLVLFLPPSFPALKPYTNPEEPLLADLPHPFLLIQPTQASDYGDLKAVSASSVRIQTASREIKNLVLQLGDTVYPANADVPLVGATAQNVTSYLYLTTPEISLKTISFKANDLKSTSLPITDGGVLQTPEVLVNGVWKPLADSVSVPTDDPPTGSLHYPEASGQTFLRVKTYIEQPATGDPIKTYKITPESISVSYRANEITVFPGRPMAGPHGLLHYLPFGGLAKIKEPVISMVPDYQLPAYDTPLESTPPAADEPADGNLLLGFENLLPNQTLSVLFKMQDGTGNPDLTAPEIAWSYYRDNLPVRFPAQYILSDETDGLSRTGIIRFRIPHDITSGIKAVPGEKGRLDLYWLMASATENPAEGIAIEALPFIHQMHAQAATAVFQNHNNTLEHLEQGLPANTISQLRVRDVNVRKVSQPYASTDGRLPEGTDTLAYYRRISERLRHKQRAITVWDYERLVLEQFPKMEVAKCLSHTEKDDLTAPGAVTLAVIPNPDRQTGEGRFYPSAGAGERKAIATYLNQHNSFFVSGVGGLTTCCCHDDEEPTDDEKPCGCPPASRLRVVNARFEPVRLQVCVRFRQGKDIPFHTKLLNDALRQFLAPWTFTGGPPIAFGTVIQTTQLLRFLENLDYVDVVMSLKVKHFASKDEMLTDEPAKPWTVADSLQPLTPRSVLTTYLNLLDEENPNGIDHEINVLPGDGHCRCSACLEAALEEWIKAQPNWATLNSTLKAHLDGLVKQGELVGDTSKTADEANREFNGAAYWFALTPDATSPTAVSFALATHPHAPFVKPVVNKPLTP